MVEVVAGRDQGQALGDPLAIGDGRRHLGDQPLGLADVGGVVRRRRVDVGVEVSQHADRGAEHVHRVDVLRGSGGRGRPGARGSPEPCGGGRRTRRTGSWRQVAVQEQERGLLVRDVTGQVFDPVAAVLEPAGPVAALDVGDRRLAGDHAFQAGTIFFRRARRSFPDSAEFGRKTRPDRAEIPSRTS